MKLPLLTKPFQLLPLQPLQIAVTTHADVLTVVGPAPVVIPAPAWVALVVVGNDIKKLCIESSVAPSILSWCNYCTCYAVYAGVHLPSNALVVP